MGRIEQAKRSAEATRLNRDLTRELAQYKPAASAAVEQRRALPSLAEAGESSELADLPVYASKDDPFRGHPMSCKCCHHR